MSPDSLFIDIAEVSYPFIIWNRTTNTILVCHYAFCLISTNFFWMKECFHCPFCIKSSVRSIDYLLSNFKIYTILVKKESFKCRLVDTDILRPSFRSIWKQRMGFFSKSRHSWEGIRNYIFKFIFNSSLIFFNFKKVIFVFHFSTILI